MRLPEEPSGPPRHGSSRPLPLRRWAAIELPQEVRQLDLQARHLHEGDIADDVEVDAEVVVNQHVPHPCDLAPSDARRASAKGVRDALGSLPEDFKVAKNRVDGPSVGASRAASSPAVYSITRVHASSMSST